MVKIFIKSIKGNEYYYLEHSFRLNGNIEKKEIYLGLEIPKNINKIKANFLHEIYNQKWYPRLNIIKTNFLKEFRIMPKIAKQKYMEDFMIKFTYESNKIEGSTLTLRETANLLEEGITPKNKPIKDIKETETHKKVFYEMLDYSKDLSLKEILHWHNILFKNTEIEIAGIRRKHQVRVAGSKTQFPLHLEVDLMLREFFIWYHQNKKTLHPVELAALVHLKFVSIHPFSDGNGRISRILMNFILQKNRFPMLNIQYSNRSNYYTALERAQTKQDDKIFVQHIFRRYIKENKHWLKNYENK